MNKTIVIVGIVILLVASGVFLVNQKQDTQTAIEESAEPLESFEEDSENNSAGRYVEYSKEVLESASSNRRVLYFYASWCPTCRPADANFKANENKIPQDVTLIRVNYNDPDTDPEEKTLAGKYGITYQHTFVQIDSNGTELAKWNGGQIDELLKQIR